jgi:hypothetical protein
MAEVRELRIHGVGGSPGEALLGLSRPEDAVVVGEGLGTVFLARRQDLGRPVEGYDWGSLTSSSMLQPLWLLLLSFTLMNVAGWMHPPFSHARRGQVTLIRGLVHALSGLLTAAWTLWIGLIMIDYLGYQWLRSLTDNSIVQLTGFVAGVVAAAGLVGFLLLIGKTTKQEFEAQQPDKDVLGPGEGTKKWARDETLVHRTFFAHEPSIDRLLLWHLAVAVTVLISMVVKAWIEWGAARLLLGEFLIAVGALQLGLLGVLWTVSWSTGGHYAHALSCHSLAAAAATLSVALNNGFLSGVALLVSRMLPDDRQRSWGPELALVDVFVIVLLAWAITGIAFFIKHRSTGDASDLPPRRSSLSQELDGVDKRWRAAISKARGFANAGRSVPKLLTVLALEFLLLAGGFGLLRINPESGQPPWRWMTVPNIEGWLFQAAAVILPGLVLALMSLVRRASTTPRLRRTVGILWDVLTFWPRRFHPFAVRPYTERAVPEFQARINGHLQSQRRVLVSAHSQGSVLAFASLAPLKEWKLGRTALLTYGCPITTLYGQVFPAYFGQDQVEQLRGKLLGGRDGWINLWRKTDPIGGPVFGSALGGDPGDVHIDDPATQPASEDIPNTSPLPEDYRRAWVEIAGHSHFFREQRMKEAVARLSEALLR